MPEASRASRARAVAMRAAYAALALLLPGCEGLFTGERATVEPLAESADGSFAPVRLQLDPSMNPLAFNLRGSTVATPIEAGRYNSYRATLLLDGAPVATGQFNVNNRGSDESPQGESFAVTMLIASVPQAGEYELRIQAAQPKEITIESPQLEVRRKVELPPGASGASGATQPRSP